LAIEVSSDCIRLPIITHSTISRRLGRAEAVADTLASGAGGVGVRRWVARGHAGRVSLLPAGVAGRQL